MTKTTYCLAALLCALFLTDFGQTVARSADQGIVATVNDIPITSFDIDQRLRLMEILGQKKQNDARKKALDGMIDEIIKIAEARKYKVNASDKDIDAQLGRVAKGLNTDTAGLIAKLQSQGIAISSLKQYVAAQIAFARILGGKYQVKIKVQPAEVDKKFNEIKQELEQKVSTVMSDPRMRPTQVYSIIEIDLPVESPDDSMLLQARAIEAMQLIKNFKGCKTARAAAAGIFNVKIGKPIDAITAKIPKPMKEALDKVGPGKAMGPARGPKGIQVIGFCGKRIIQPPKPKYELPTREQVEAAVSNEKYDAVENKYMAIMRKTALIEYKDPAYAQP